MYWGKHCHYEGVQILIMAMVKGRVCVSMVKGRGCVSESAQVGKLSLIWEIDQKTSVIRSECHAAMHTSLCW